MSQNNRLILILGAVAAVVAAVVIAMLMNRGPAPDTPPPASKGGLQLEVTEVPTLEPTRELRCFVDGQFVGLTTLADCARRNGLATDALDVGIDASGELAAAPTASFTPPPALPPVDLAEVGPPPGSTLQPAPQTTPLPAPSTQPVPVSGPSATCLRHTGNDWTQMSSATDLNTCVQMLFSGTCVRPGEARYGRWGDMTLRLVPRRVEQSGDNVRFRTLAEQDRNCAIARVN